MGYAAAWWLWIELLGIIALPLSFQLFKNLPDRGYAFGKVLGILAPSYLLWLAATIGILPNTRLSIFALVALTTLVSLFVLYRSSKDLSDFLSRNWKTVLATELVFTLFFVAWVVIKSYSPEIQHTEQPMDFALLNGILRSTHFPPNDPWLSGQSVSYYYFGYLMMAMLTKLSAIPSSISYNLSLALVFGLTASGAFSLVFNLVRGDARKPLSLFGMAMLFGAIGALFLVVTGNLEGLLEMLYAHNVGSQDFWKWVGIGNLDKPYTSTGWAPSEFWWWWKATRVIDGSMAETITEFPVFSFVLGDLHPHVLSLPFVVTALALSLNVFLAPGRLALRWITGHPLEFALTALALGSLIFINSWDFPVFLAVFLAAVALKVFSDVSEDARTVWRGAALFALCLVLGSVLLYLPYYLGPRIPIQGIWIVDVNTRYLHYGIIWGLFLFAAVSLVACCAIRWLRLGKVSWTAPMVSAVVVLGPFALWAALELLASLFTSGISEGLGDIAGKLLSLFPLLAVLFVGTWALVHRLRQRSEGPRVGLFGLLLVLVGLYLTMGVELFYIRDLFGNRMNTVFKLYYQAWTMLAIGGGFGLYYVGARWQASSKPAWLGHFFWRVALVVLVIGAGVYPVAATYSRSDAFKAKQTLDGLAWVQQQDPDEYAAVQWLQQNVEGSPVIVEAVGGSYSEYARVSSRTGLPAVLGWPGHEQQWRGSGAAYAGREQDVALIYQSKDAELVKSLLQKYNITYVYVGAPEKKQYPSGDFTKFGAFMDVAFQGGGVVIYKVR